MAARGRSNQGATRPVRRILLLAYAGSLAAITGVQLITPALPAIQRAFALSDVEIGLVTSLFLLPGVLLAAPIGLITDRVGRRAVYCTAMVLMGGGGVMLLLVHDVRLFFAVRVLQGVAFAALLPVTATLIGDVVRGREQVRAQGRRNIAMAMGDAGLPLVGGALVLMAWYAPFAVQVLALPLAVAGWKLIGDRDRSLRHRPDLRALGRLLRSSVAVAIQVAGVLRFLFKFALLSYLPILLDGRGAAPLVIAVSLAALAVAGIVSASGAPAIVGRIRPSVLVMACLATMGGTMAAIALVPSLAITISALVVFGFADVLYAVLQNATMVSVVSDQHRASFVAAIGAVRNFGKFIAPTVVGALLLGVQLEHAFLILAGVALFAVPTGLAFRTVDDELRHGEMDGESLT